MGRGPSKSASKVVEIRPDQPKQPTDAELAILQVLWRTGPSTVAELHEEMTSSISYPTVQSFLRIMIEKGLVQAEQLKYAWRYRATYSEEEVQQTLVTALLKKAFGGSPAKLLMQALASNKTSPEELSAIKRLCEQHKKP